MNAKLSCKMTVKDFDHHYYYAKDLKEFAQHIGVKNASRLRKDQLEQVIRGYLRTGEIEHVANISDLSPVKDSERGLTMNTPILHYTNDKVTKAFLFENARKLDPHFKQKSGAMYWINRWRDDQLAQGHAITYGDLVREFVRLNHGDERLPRIPSTKFNNFVTDYLNHEKDATRADALKAWEWLKSQDAPKTYQGWKDAVG